MPEKVEIRMMGYRCERCGHEWVPIREQAPATCPKCKSPYWDRPRRRPSPAAPDAGRGAEPRRQRPAGGREDGADAP